MNYLHQKKLTFDQDTIVALSTPKGSGAIAIIRLSGQDSLDIADKISRLSNGEKIVDCKSHTIKHGFVVDKKTEQDIDEVLFFIMRLPRTFTGQDIVEISCHNNQFIIENIVALSIFAGARLAKPGEFAQRAFLNGKIDLVQAESINDLIGAQTQLAVQKSLSQVKGSLSNFILKIEEKLLYILALVEGSFEFLEEEARDLDMDNLIRNSIDNLLNELNQLKDSFNIQQQIKNGIKISLVGYTNVGKSTLFNALLGKNRSIVTHIEGTTRDVIESNLYKNGSFWQLTDTAGLRDTTDFMEKEGIERSLEQIKVSDIVVLILDSSKSLITDQIKLYDNIVKFYRDKIIFVANKSDIKESKKILLKLNQIFNTKFLAVSGKNKIGLDLLEAEIEKMVQKMFKEFKSPFLLNKRQISTLVELIGDLEFIKQSFLQSLEYELIAHHIKNILGKLTELTGKNINEKLLDKIFKDFCVGK